MIISWHSLSASAYWVYIISVGNTDVVSVLESDNGQVCEGYCHGWKILEYGGLNGRWDLMDEESTKT